MSTIIVVGYSAWDMIFPLAETPSPDSKTEVSPIVACGGGPAANAAVALCKLGARVRLVSVLSDDVFGQAQLAELETAGVDVSLTRTIANSRSPLAVIRVDPYNGERRIYWERGDLPLYDPGDVDTSWLADADLLLCDSHEAPAAAILAAAARRNGLPVVLDAGSVRPGVPELAAQCTDVIGATGFACTVTGVDDQKNALRHLRKQGPVRVGTTFGQAGILGLDGDGFRHVQAFETPIVDTTGAGDAFHAGYAWSLAVGAGFEASLRFGAAVAALQCRSYGGRAGLPSVAEVENLLALGKTRTEVLPVTPQRRG